MSQKLLLLTSHEIPQTSMGLSFPVDLLDAGEFLNFGVYDIIDYGIISKKIFSQLCIIKARAIDSRMIENELTPLNTLEEALTNIKGGHHPKDLMYTSVLFNYYLFNATLYSSVVVPFAIDSQKEIVSEYFHRD